MRIRLKQESTWPSFLTTRRGEVRERAVRTRRESDGGKRRTQAYFTVHRSSDISSGANQAPNQRFSRNTRHESRPFSRVLRPSGGEKGRLEPNIDFDRLIVVNAFYLKAE